MVFVDLTKPRVFVLVQRNPWESGKLAIAAKKLGIRIKKKEFYRSPPPWSRYRDYDKGASDAQKKVWAIFGYVSHEHAGKSVEERVQALRRALEHKKFSTREAPEGYRSRWYTPRENFRKLFSEEELRKLLREYGIE